MGCAHCTVCKQAKLPSGVIVAIDDTLLPVGVPVGRYDVTGQPGASALTASAVRATPERARPMAAEYDRRSGPRWGEARLAPNEKPTVAKPSTCPLDSQRHPPSASDTECDKWAPPALHRTAGFPRLSGAWSGRGAAPTTRPAGTSEPSGFRFDFRTCFAAPLLRDGSVPSAAPQVFAFHRRCASPSLSSDHSAVSTADCPASPPTTARLYD